jgi:hypothetical protein
MIYGKTLPQRWNKYERRWCWVHFQLLVIVLELELVLDLPPADDSSTPAPPPKYASITFGPCRVKEVEFEDDYDWEPIISHLDRRSPRQEPRCSAT